MSCKEDFKKKNYFLVKFVLNHFKHATCIKKGWGQFMVTPVAWSSLWCVCVINLNFDSPTQKTIIRRNIQWYHFEKKAARVCRWRNRHVLQIIYYAQLIFFLIIYWCVRNNLVEWVIERKSLMCIVNLNMHVFLRLRI